MTTLYAPHALSDAERGTVRNIVKQFPMLNIRVSYADAWSVGGKETHEKAALLYRCISAVENNQLEPKE